MESLLDAFKKQLSRIERMIAPVHMETAQLTRARSNMQTVLTQVQQLEQYYSMSDKLAVVIDQGPAYKLDGYLSALDKIEQGLTYFKQSNPNHPDVRALQALRRKGQQALENEFEQLLERFSSNPDRDSIMMALEDQEIELDNGAEQLSTAPLTLDSDTVETLCSIVEWLVRTDDHNQCIKTYVKYRSNVVASILDQTRQLNPLTPAARTPRAKTPARQQRNTLRASMRRRSDTKTRRNTESSVGSDEDAAGVYVQGTDPVLQHIRGYLVAARKEYALAETIFSEEELPTVLRKLFGPALDALVVSIKSNLEIAGRHLRNKSFFALLSTFDVLRELHHKAPHFEQLLQQADGGLMSKYHQITLNVAELARSVTLEAQDHIHTDQSKKLPEDATVHELTVQSVKFLSASIDYCEAVATALRPDLPEMKLGLGWLKDRAAYDMLADWMRPAVAALQSNLSRKSRDYLEESVAAVFLLNNYNYVITYLGTDRFRKILGSGAEQDVEALVQLMDKELERYEKATWNPALEMLQFEEVSGQLTKKERDVIKQRYAGFNEAFAKVYAVQAELSVPDSVLRDSIIKRNVELVLPKYKRFDEAYRHSGFSVKNPEKYLKYTPSDVDSSIRHFFGA
eukprot:TRINITY_DN8998_c0_g4_i3.p1 TRINITY_DN8998_c0_g4~~TRINITY_DN8998_c0_g4_i3.p1  ORF type:complete len:675 (+),score=186.32 TRINITY_DN8998_c0_g4_i3:146-2026(+)